MFFMFFIRKSMFLSSMMQLSQNVITELVLLQTAECSLRDICCGSKANDYSSAEIRVGLYCGLPLATVTMCPLSVNELRRQTTISSI